MKKIFSAVLVAGALLTGSTVSAGTITFELDDDYGAAIPSGVLTATFEDFSGYVLLTMDATALTLTEYVKEWVFNFSGDVDTLDFTYDSGVVAPQIKKGNNLFDPPTLDENKVDIEPAKGFDIGFSFDEANSANRFGPTAVAGDPSVSVYRITSTAALTASMFNVALNDATYPYFTAAKVNALANGQSAKQGDGDSSDNEEPTSVPEPSSAAAAIFGLGAIGLAGRFVRK
jgi:hypothetical protein